MLETEIQSSVSKLLTGRNVTILVIARKKVHKHMLVPYYCTEPEEVRHISVFSHQCCAGWELRSADGTSHLLHSSLRCSGYSAWSTSQTSRT